MVGARRLAWSVVEDEALRALVCLHGCQWKAVAAGLVGRTAESARFRWGGVRLMHVSAAPAVVGLVAWPEFGRVQAGVLEGASDVCLDRWHR